MVPLFYVLISFMFQIIKNTPIAYAIEASILIRVTTLVYTNLAISTLFSTCLYCVLYRAAHVFTYQINKTLRPFSINLHLVISHHPITLCCSYVLIYLSFQRFILNLNSLYTRFLYLSITFFKKIKPFYFPSIRC